jgi:RNA polymerase sigma factor (sigma-70 family)
MFTRYGHAMGDPRVAAREEHTRAADHTLVGRCRQDDQNAWRELVGLYERLVYSVPRSYGFGAEDAADITQATFASLLAGLDSLRDDEALVPWLGTVARRHTWRLIERQRRERETLHREHPLLDASNGPELQDTEDPYEDWVQRAWLSQGLAALDPGCHALLTALYLDAGDNSYRAVSARLGIAVGTIGPARGRSQQRLRAALGDP